MENRNSVNLPSILTEDTWFMKDKRYKEKLEPFIGKYYISYSTVSSFNNYIEDFVKQKLLNIPNNGSIYTRLGSFVGEAIEKGSFNKDNPDGFEGMENINLEELRPPNAEFERLVIIDFEDYVFIGFIDRYITEEDGIIIDDFKTGSKNKKDEYLSKDYIQIPLYSIAVNREFGKNIVKDTRVYFIEREGSHISPPLRLTSKQEYIPIEYNKAREEYALIKLENTVKNISELKNTFDKFFFRNVKM